MRLCKNCKWCGDQYREGYEKCTHPRIAKTSFDLVTGKGERDTIYCRFQRKRGFISSLFWGECGKRGKFWEVK